MSAKRNTKRERILAAATHLWQQTHNVNKVSLADIAREAGVSPTTVYNNFGTRDGLVQEVTKHLTREILDKQRAIVKSDLPIPLKMQSILSVKMTNLQGMQAELVAKFSTDPVIGKYLDEVYESEIKQMMATIIEEGKQQGYINPDLPDEVIMLYLDILKTGGIAYANALQRLVSDSRLMAALIRVFYYGLFQKEFDLTVDYGTKKEAA
jgi:AcrR family transcriptional regulator